MKVPEHPILFLDIDGVVIPFGDTGIPSASAHQLRRVVREAGVGIVISSTWRMPPIERLLKVWRAAGLPESWIIGVTPDLALSPGNDKSTVGSHDCRQGLSPDSRPDQLRGREIRAWLNANATAATKFAIVDDQCDDITPCFPPEVVFVTRSEYGLTRQIAENIIRWLTCPR